MTADTEASSTPSALLAMHALIERSFPRIAKNLPRETVSNYSLLYTWPGRHPDRPPVILTAHLDVVPADPQTAAEWRHPAFDGVIAEDAIWGRGTLDDKAGAFGLLEAVEALLAQGFVPDRTVYLGFGHDEESGAGSTGAPAIAARLAARGVHDAVLMDEGGLVLDGMPGLPRPIAVIGIAEKGFTSIELVVTSAGGHSSMPPRETAVGVLARAVDRVERTPMPPRIDGATRALFETLAPEMPFGYRLLFGNLGLTRHLLISQLGRAPRTNALIRTTTAPTMLRASAKENVLASEAAAVVNFRTLPGDTPASVLAHVTRAVNDPRVTVRFYRGNAGSVPSAVSPIDTDDFRALGRAIRAAYPDALVAPYLTVGATDARAYGAVASAVYRFLPVDQPGGAELLHAPNEHLGVANYGRTIQAYANVIVGWTR